MPPDLSAAHNFSTEGRELGAPATWIFEGEDGLQRLSTFSAFSSPGSSLFEARLTRVQLDHFALEDFAATAHSWSRTSWHINNRPIRVLTFTFVKVGRVRVETADASFPVESGEFFITDSSCPMTGTADATIRVLRSVIGVDHVPTHLLNRGTTIARALQRTPLVDSFIAFQTTILSSAMGGRSPSGDQLIRAVSELHSAVLAEAQHTVSEPTGTAAMRLRMEEYIDQHFAERDLRPETIATAMGISLRQAHNIFNDGDRTISRFIRDRRIEALAFTLREGQEQISAAELARRHGFATAESMSRAFRNHYGIAPTEYRAAGYNSFG